MVRLEVLIDDVWVPLKLAKDPNIRKVLVNDALQLNKAALSGYSDKFDVPVDGNELALQQAYYSEVSANVRKIPVRVYDDSVLRHIGVLVIGKYSEDGNKVSANLVTSGFGELVKGKRMQDVIDHTVTLGDNVVSKGATMRGHNSAGLEVGTIRWPMMDGRKFLDGFDGSAADVFLGWLNPWNKDNQNFVVQGGGATLFCPALHWKWVMGLVMNGLGYTLDDSAVDDERWQRELIFALISADEDVGPYDAQFKTTQVRIPTQVIPPLGSELNPGPGDPFPPPPDDANSFYQLQVDQVTVQPTSAGVNPLPSYIPYVANTEGQYNVSYFLRLRARAGQAIPVGVRVYVTNEFWSGGVHIGPTMSVGGAAAGDTVSVEGEVNAPWSTFSEMRLLINSNAFEVMPESFVTVTLAGERTIELPKKMEIKNYVPDMTVGEFLTTTKQKMGLRYVIDDVNKSVTLLPALRSGDAVNAKLIKGSISREWPQTARYTLSSESEKRDLDGLPVITVDGFDDLPAPFLNTLALVKNQGTIYKPTTISGAVIWLPHATAYQSVLVGDGEKSNSLGVQLSSPLIHVFDYPNTLLGSDRKFMIPYFDVEKGYLQSGGGADKIGHIISMIWLGWDQTNPDASLRYPLASVARYDMSGAVVAGIDSDLNEIGKLLLPVVDLVNGVSISCRLMLDSVVADADLIGAELMINNLLWRVAKAEMGSESGMTVAVDLIRTGL